jgi:hypothetical protein
MMSNADREKTMTQDEFAEMIAALIDLARAGGLSDATIQAELATAVWSLKEGLT